MLVRVVKAGSEGGISKRVLVRSGHGTKTETRRGGVQVCRVGCVAKHFLELDQG